MTMADKCCCCHISTAMTVFVLLDALFCLAGLLQTLIICYLHGFTFQYESQEFATIGSTIILSLFLLSCFVAYRGLSNVSKRQVWFHLVCSFITFVWLTIELALVLELTEKAVDLVHSTEPFIYVGMLLIFVSIGTEFQCLSWMKRYCRINYYVELP